jgi:uncharacterized protein DUF6714
MDIEEIFALIDKLFPTQPIPDLTIHQAQLSDQGMSREISDKEWKSEKDKDVNTTWLELSDYVLMECNAALSHLDENSFVYYIPAYIKFALKNIN